MFHVEQGVSCGNSVGKRMFHVKQPRVEFGGAGETNSILLEHNVVTPFSFHVEHRKVRGW
jgi:hypothetical protein